MDKAYWKETVETTLDELGVKLDESIVKSMVESFAWSHDCYGQYSGADVADRNLRASQEDEIKRMIQAVKDEAEREAARAREAWNGRERELEFRMARMRDEIERLRSERDD